MVISDPVAPSRPHTSQDAQSEIIPDTLAKVPDTLPKTSPSRLPRTSPEDLPNTSPNAVPITPLSDTHPSDVLPNEVLLAKVLHPTKVLVNPPHPSGRYVLQDGLRKVEPYFWTFNTYCKERWRDRPILDIFHSEFRDKPPGYYERAIRTGTVMVNAKTVATDYLVRNGDLITHSAHRHEPPVTADPIGIIHEDDGMMVVNKPSGVPVHPAGRYNYNCLIEIMKAERRPDGLLHPCNRLDRLTSGLMFVSKTPAAAEEMRRQIIGRTVRKEYVARVAGRFPDGEVVCDQPILQISPKVGLNRVRATGKSARTVFQRLAYYPAGTSSDGTASAESTPAEKATTTPADKTAPVRTGYSVVRCMPVTGRTHQIRVHLQFLGHPVQNDPIYANSNVWGFDLGYNDADGSANSDEDIVSRLSRMGKDEAADAIAYHDHMVDEYHKRRAEKLTGELCEVCQAPLYTDPGRHELSLWLHSLRYEDAGGKWSYISPLPAWALPPSGLSGPTEVGSMNALVDAVGGDVNS